MNNYNLRNYNYNIMNKHFKYQDVLNQQFSNSKINLNDNTYSDLKDDFLFFKSYPTIKDNSFSLQDSSADFVCAFFSTKDTTINIKFNNVILITQKLKENCYTVPLCNYIPISCLYLTYCDVDILENYDSEIHFIGCICFKNFKYYLQRSSVMTSMIYPENEETLILYYQGRIFYNKDNIDDRVSDKRDKNKILWIPHYNYEKYREYLSRKVSDKIYPEIIFLKKIS